MFIEDFSALAGYKVGILESLQQFPTFSMEA